jgi:hypothetical protein
MRDEHAWIPRGFLEATMTTSWTIPPAGVYWKIESQPPRRARSSRRLSILA